MILSTEPEKVVTPCILDIVSRSKEISDKTGGAFGYENVDYVSNSYLSELHRWLTGNHYFFNDPFYLKFGEELHKRYLEPWKDHVYLGLEAEVKLQRMLAILKSYPDLEEYREQATANETIELMLVEEVWQMGQHVKVKIDEAVITKKHRSAKDLKTTSARTFSEFMQATIKFRYWKQAALYMEVGRFDDFEFIAPSKHNDDVYRVNVREYPDLLLKGKLQAQYLIQTHQSLKHYVNFATTYLGTF